MASKALELDPKGDELMVHGHYSRAKVLQNQQISALRKSNFLDSKHTMQMRRLTEELKEKVNKYILKEIPKNVLFLHTRYWQIANESLLGFGVVLSENINSKVSPSHARKFLQTSESKYLPELRRNLSLLKDMETSNQTLHPFHGQLKTAYEKLIQSLEVSSKQFFFTKYM